VDGIRLIMRVREEPDAVLLGYSRPGFEATHLADGQARNGEKVRKPVALVVEDDPLLRLDAIDMVEEAGFLTLEAANAQQAIQYLESRSDIRIIVSDIDMPPGMDGIALARMVHHRWPPIAIILVSGKVVSEVLIPEGDSFFSKPFRRADLIATLHRMAA
jgi:CheY-like chemotaxis protein